MPRHSSDEALRREASAWFAEMQREEADGKRAAFETWYAEPAHAQAYDRLARRWRQSGLLAQTRTGRNRSLDRARSPFFGLRSNRPMALAAGLIIVTAIAAGLFAFRFGKKASPEIATAIGQIHTVRLADGSMVTLDTNSALRTALSPSLRAVTLLRGRARFDVAHDIRRPFLVEAAGTRVMARGTMFDVDMTGPRLRVTLYRGVVDIRRNGQESVVRLSPGERATSSPAGRTQIAPAPGGEAQWVDGLLSFDNAPLRDVLAQANRYSSSPIRAGDTTLSATRITGVFHARETELLARALAAMLGVELHRSGDDWVLARAGPA